jgi:O-antigen/teichoic acid export membrane protein
MPKQQLGLLSFGVLVIIIAILLVVFAPDWGSIIPLTLMLYGLWVIVLSGIRNRTPEKYGRSAFSILIWGILLLAIGGAWYLNILTGNILYSVVLFLVIVGVVALASALLRTKK